MDEFEKQQPSTSETQIEKPEESKDERERQRRITIQSVADYKRSIDSTIESQARTVQQIFSAFERRPVEGREMLSEKALQNPEEVISKIKAGISRLGHSTVDDIPSEMLDIESWLTANKSKVESLFSRKWGLENRSRELSAQLAKEEHKNFFKKIFREKERRVVSTQLRETSDEIAQTDASLAEHQLWGEQVEADLREFSVRRQELALNAVERLFKNVLEKHKQLKEKLTSPDVKYELNEDLITRKILPELDRLQTEGKITREDAEEYLGLLKMQLSEGRVSNWNDPLEKREAIDALNKHMDDLNEKSQNSLIGIGELVSINDSDEAVDHYYDSIFDFLLREVTKERVEQLRDSLGGSLNPELQAKVAEIAEEIICPYSDLWTPREKKREVLDLSKLPIEDFEQFDGLERWRVVKDFAKLSGVIPKEVFTQVEKIIIQRLFDGQLFPGVQVPREGFVAARKMGDLGNPEALLLMLRHIETYGPGTTNEIVSCEMKRLLKESDPLELQQTLESLPVIKRILLETLADENSYLNRFSRFNFSFPLCYLLQNSNLTVAKEWLTKILDRSGELDEKKLEDFYLKDDDISEILELFLKARSEVEKIIIDSKLEIWIQSADKLLAALVNPRNGESVAFPKRIMREGLGISDEKMLAVLDKIFEAKTFKGSVFEREAFLDGLVLLNSKENGKDVLEKLLSTYRGARNDPARMRRVFQLLSTLNCFGEYDFIVPDQAEISDVSQEITDLQNQYSQTQDKAERKKIKNRIETLNGDLQNLTGLKGIEDVMMQKVAEVGCKRLELPQKYRDKIVNNFEELQKSGVFEIVYSLAGKYEGIKETEVKNLLHTITIHIIEGDFKSWRYAHERSEAQLVGLTEEQKEFWKGTLEPVVIDIEFPEDEKSRRAGELKVIQEMIKDAKEHILDSKPNFDFSKERGQTLATKISELIEMIKSAVSEDEKKRFALEKKVMQAQAALINGILEIENTTSQSFTRERILTQARELLEGITDLNLPLAGLDIEQIEKVFTVGDIKSVTAHESDDALTLLKIGVEPQETCQSWRRGGLNECLLAYVVDSNKKVLNITNGEGIIVARSIIKLTNQRDKNDFESKTQRKTLLVERLYSLLPNIAVYQAFVRVLLAKAQGIDASITFGNSFDKVALQIFTEEARAVGYEINRSDLDIFIPHSLNKYEYSDALGGKISLFDRYKQLGAGEVTFEKSKDNIRSLYD